MPTREFTVTNKLGIHARPAAQFVKTASNFSCDIQVEKDDEQADGKSIMGLMMLAAGHGSILTIPSLLVTVNSRVGIVFIGLKN